MTVSGANATAIVQGLDAIFASQTPPVSPGKAYWLTSLACGASDLPGGSGAGCSLAVGRDAGSPIAVRDTPTSMLAENLLEAVEAALPTPCLGLHGPEAQIQNVSVTANEVQFDDASDYATFDAPNILVRGADAQALIRTLAAAGIDDCDPTRNLFIVCNTLGGAPTCGHQWMNLVTVGASELEPICAPGGGTEPEPPFDAATSLAVWNAIVKAAADAGFQPSNGTIAQTTVINADYFTWDGTTLAFSLVADDPTPPPSISGSAADGG